MRLLVRATPKGTVFIEKRRRAREDAARRPRASLPCAGAFDRPHWAAGADDADDERRAGERSVTSELKLTAKDFKSDQEVRWCPGCGDYAILAAVQSFMPELGIERENIVFVSGIGCAARFPYYMQTYGMHSIHGRAPAIATGLAVSRPDLSVWVVRATATALSIGGNHLIHALRRNVNIKILMLNNQIYGLTKGQYSPTSEQGKVTGSTPMGSVDYPFNPLCRRAGRGRHVRRARPRHGQAGPDGRAAPSGAHKGAAFVEIFQNCNIYNDGAFDFVRDEKENRMYLEHGEVAGDTGITHDETDFATAFALSRVTYDDAWRRPARRVQGRAARQLRRARRGAARERQGRRGSAGARWLGRHLGDRVVVFDLDREESRPLRIEQNSNSRLMRVQEFAPIHDVADTAVESARPPAIVRRCRRSTRSSRARTFFLFMKHFAPISRSPAIPSRRTVSRAWPCWSRPCGRQDTGAWKPAKASRGNRERRHFDLWTLQRPSVSQWQ